MKKFLVLATVAACLVQSNIAQAADSVAFNPGLSYGKTDKLAEVSSLAVGKDDFLVVATTNKVFIYDPAKPESVRSFDSGFSHISAVAVSGETIYVFSRKTETKEFESSGRKYKREVPIAALCKTFSWDGTPTGDIELEKLVDVINAKIYDGKIYVADFGGTHKVRVFDARTGKSVDTIGKDLRLCCGILDFAIDPKNGEVLIANLGAFRLERYSAQGNLRESFGKRGEDAGSFQGCCNPVTAAVLPDGNLVVVQKDPSQVKIFTPKGKLLFQFANLQELVNGCNMVSTAVDSQGRIYLGVNARDHFVLQYVPKA